MQRHLVLPLLIAQLFALPVIASAESPRIMPETIKPHLQQTLLARDTTLNEVKAFTESRVVQLPEIDSPAAWNNYANQLRRRVLNDVVFRGEAADWRELPLKVEWLETVEGGPGYKIRKLRYEAVPGLWVPALLYEPLKLTGKVPVVMHVNGHSSVGKVTSYKQARCINLARRGILNLNVEWLGMGQLRSEGMTHYRMNQLDLCGTSGLAPFYLSMSKGLDILLSHEHADPRRVAVAGLSGGGWQTIFISSLDTRVKLANPVAGYSSFRTRVHHTKDLGDSEQTPSDLAAVADYTHLTALLAPRPALLTYNSKDNCCFEAGYALPPLVEAASPFYKLLEASDALRTHVNNDPGTHNFDQDNRQALYRMIGDHFYRPADKFDWREINVGDEIQTAEQLHVDLPDDNATFNTLALSLAKSLPRAAALPTKKPAALAWQTRRREELAELVRLPQYQVVAKAERSEQQDSLSVRTWRLRLGESWTVPAVELSSGKPTGTVIVLADAGRAMASESVARHLSAGRRVVAIDPFYFGEAAISEKPHLYAILSASVGERPLGIQAGQVAAVARWLKQRDGESVEVAGAGPRSSLIALVAAAVEHQAISGAELAGSYGSLKEILEENQSVDRMPEQFCFGLLAQTDILQLAALVAPRPVTFPSPSKRVRRELAPLESWYKLHGSDHQPVE